MSSAKSDTEWSEEIEPHMMYQMQKDEYASSLILFQFALTLDWVVARLRAYIDFSLLCLRRHWSRWLCFGLFWFALSVGRVWML